MLSRRLQRILRLQRISAGLVGLTFGILISILANWLSDQFTQWIPVLVAVLIVSSIVAVVLYLREPVNPVRVAIRSPITIHSELDAKQYARQGFVGFVPLFTPRWNSPASKLSLEERRKAIDASAFDQLDIENSNFMPTVQAIASHRSRLQYCWLISTIGDDGTGTFEYAPLLIDYLKKKYGLTCEFYWGEELTINLETDAEVPQRIYDQVVKAFASADSKGLPPQDLVVDVTTGIRSMALGATLACLDAEHDIEFVGTAYDASGNPTGPLYPIIFNFEALPN